MFCQKCGAKISDDGIFCEVCGNPVKQQQYVRVVTKKPPVPGRGLGIAGMSLSIAGLAYGAYAIFFAVFTSGFTRLVSASIASVILTLFLSALSILGIVFSNISRNKGYITKISNSGLIMGVVGLPLYFIAFLISLVG